MPEHLHFHLHLFDSESQNSSDQRWSRHVSIVFSESKKREFVYGSWYGHSFRRGYRGQRHSICQYELTTYRGLQLWPSCRNQCCFQHWNTSPKTFSNMYDNICKIMYYFYIIILSHAPLSGCARGQTGFIQKNVNITIMYS